MRVRRPGGLRDLTGKARRIRSDSVARDTVWGTGFDALQLLVMLLSFTLLGKQLGPSVFGSYAAMYAIVGIAGSFVYLGVTLAVVQHLVRDRHPLTQVLHSCLGLVFVTGVCGAVIGTAVGHLTIPSLDLVTLAAFMSAELLGAASIEVLAATVYARDGVAVATRYRIVPLIGKLTVLLALFGTGRLTIEALGLAYVVLYPITAVVLARALGRRYGVKVRLGRPRWDYLRSSTTYAGAIAAMGLQNDGDKIVMTASRIGADAGLYAAAYRLVMLGLVPLRALLGASHRRFLEHDPDARNQHVRRSLRFTAVGAAYGVVFGIALFVAAPLITLLLGDQYDGAVMMLRALAPIVVLRSCAEFGLNGLLGLGRVAVRTGATVIAAGVAMAAYIMLIPALGWQGAVLGTYLSEAVLGIVAWSCLLHYQRRHNAELDDRAAGAVRSNEAPRASAV